jgi:hypothetical protein
MNPPLELYVNERDEKSFTQRGIHPPKSPASLGGLPQTWHISTRFLIIVKEYSTDTGHKKYGQLICIMKKIVLGAKSP